MYVQLSVSLYSLATDCGLSIVCPTFVHGQLRSVSCDSYQDRPGTDNGLLDGWEDMI